MNKYFYQFIGVFFVVLLFIFILVSFLLGYRLILPEGRVQPNWSAIGVIATITFSIGTLIISCFALYQSINTTKQQNKISLFERRLKCYAIFTGCVSLFNGANVLLKMAKSEPTNSLVHGFVCLTNNSYLENIAHAIKYPLDDKYHITYLNKLEELRTIAIETELVFNSIASICAKNFIINYVNLLQTMYKFQILYNILEKENTESPMQLEDFKSKIKNDYISQSLVEAITTLQESSEELKSKNVIENFEKQLKL